MPSLKWWAWCAVLLVTGGGGGGSGMVCAKPVVDPGLFVIKGVSSCREGEGYCMLGVNCTVDVDFLPDDEGGNCVGLREAFTPKTDFSCCKYNPLGKETSEAPTTTLSSVTVTDIFSLIDEEMLQQAQQQEEMDYENLNPENLIDIVGVVTDFTGIVGLVTRPWTGTLPTRPSTTPSPPPSTTATTPPAPMVTPVPSDEGVDEEHTEATESYHEVPTTTLTPPLPTFYPREEIQTDDPSLLNVDTEGSAASTLTTQSPAAAPEVTIEDGNGQQGSEAQRGSEQQSEHQGSEAQEGTEDQQGSETQQGSGQQGNGQQGSQDHEHQTEQGGESFLQPVNQNICGFKGPSMPEPSGVSRILGGVTASTLEWCWVAAVMERRPGGPKYICSGALLEPDLLLTTATCLKRLNQNDLSRYLVVLGDSNLRDHLPYGIQFHSIVQVALHPDHYTSGGTHVNDIGLIKLRDRATLTDNVCLICLAQQDAVMPVSARCMVVGYGLGALPDPSHSPNDKMAYSHTPAFTHNADYAEVVGGVPSEGVLRRLSVPLLDGGECRHALHNVTGSKILADSNSFLCGGVAQGVACYSTLDGGSPLSCEVGGRWFLAGLVSWSRDCSSPVRPSVYTRVSAFTGWVQAAYLRILGFTTHPLQTHRTHWIYHHVQKINKEFA